MSLSLLVQSIMPGPWTRHCQLLVIVTMDDATSVTSLSSAWELVGDSPCDKYVHDAWSSLGWPGGGMSKFVGGKRLSETVPRGIRRLKDVMLTLEAWPQHPWTLVHFMWAAIYPCLCWIEGAAEEDAGPWTPAHGHCLQMLSVDFDATTFTESQDDLASFAALCLGANLEVIIPELSLREAFVKFWAMSLPQCQMSVYLLLMSAPVMHSLIGRSMHRAVQASLLSMAARVHMPTSSLETDMKAELIEILAAKQTQQNTSVDVAITLQHEPSLKRSRTDDAISALREQKTEQIRDALVNKTPLVHQLNTIVDANRLIAKLQRQELDLEKENDLVESVVKRDSLGRHMLVLESALDAYMAEMLATQRAEDPEGFGLGMATDESPPSQPRFGGYRFQITMMYIPLWRPDETWETSEDPPLDVTAVLGDICHCPGKDGGTVMRVIDKQLARLSCSRHDLLSGTGDGGMENEGQQGVHSQLEAEVPGYVRRRCLGHIAWRVSDALLDEVPDYSVVKRLCEYMCDGSTWTRLQALATTPLLEGGLGLFPENSRKHAAVFANRPASIVDGRPESAQAFLAFLRGKEHVFHAVAQRDVADRGVVQSTVHAVALFGDVRGRAYRSVVAELLHRTLFLHQWVNNHSHIARVQTLTSLMQKAKNIIEDLSLDDNVIARLGTSREEMYAKGWRPSTWVELATYLVYNDPLLVAPALEQVMRLHEKLVSTAVSHLALIEDNVFRTTWLTATLLSSDAATAQAGAQTLLRQLLTVAPGRQSSFERSVSDNVTLMANLQAFANVTPATCLWKNHGAYKPLFRFLALRFLLSPDQVLDCERFHARWQWLCATKRALRLKSLNASLRLTWHLEQNLGRFPPHKDLAAYLHNEKARLRGIYRQLDIEDAVAPVFRPDVPFLERFNLRSADLHLLHEHAAPFLAMTTLRAEYRATASVYLRNVCGDKVFISYPGVAPDTFVYILDNKTLAGREPRDALDAHSRPLVLSFFQKVPGPMDDMIIVERCDKSFAGMSTKTLTCAELLMTLGYALPVDPARSAAGTEDMLEDAHDHVQRLLWRHELYIAPGVDVHTYVLPEPKDTEDVFFDSAAPADHTKFVLARALERTHGWNRKRLWNKKVAELRDAMATGVCPPGCDTGDDGAGGGGGRRGARGGGAAPGRRGGRGRGPAVVAVPAAAPGRRGGRGGGGGRRCRGGAGRV